VTVETSLQKTTISFLDALVPEATESTAESAAVKNIDTADSSAQEARRSESEEGVEQIAMRDTYSRSIALSVLLSFTTSLGLLAWAGSVARIAEKGL
jgi:hypothetical protein